MSFYRDAFIAMVTPLRDGMNLVAKEFVACQIEEPGVLILSPFAGAGETMQEAMIVNPYKIDAVAELIHTCLEMPLDEREVRMKHLRRRERYNQQQQQQQLTPVGTEIGLEIDNWTGNCVYNGSLYGRL